ncbi:MAG TPA: hypothetical protein VKB58_03975 [Terriglobales bacterium]|nr:hypothetical protein [Terriglobales bacterium]
MRRSVVISATNWFLTMLLMAGMSVPALAQSEAAPPPPPPPGGMMITMQGPAGAMGGTFFHEEIGLGHKVVTGAPMTATITVTHDTTLSDGNSIHTENQSTEYRDSQGRVRREVPFKLVTPATGATEGTMIIIMDPVAGKRFVLNPQKKTAHEMPLHGPEGPHSMHVMGGAQLPDGGDQNINTEQLGTKSILGLQATGTRVTRTIPAGEIGNAKPITVTTERWVSNDLQIPLAMTHTDPMMGTMTTTVTSVTRGDPDASLFQIPSDYKVESGKPGDMLYMTARP